MGEYAPNPAIEAQIAKEVALIEQHPPLANSFPLRLPFGGLRDQLSGVDYSYADEPSADLGGKSLNQLFTDIDAAVSNLGISIDIIKELQSKAYVGGDPVYNQLVLLTLPVYEALRRKGYAADSLGANYGFID